MTIKIKYVNHINQFMQQIEKSDIIARRKAAQYMAKKLRKNIGKRGTSSPGGMPSRQTGNLRKGVSFIMTKKDKAFYVGVKAPHAHLLEYGHETNVAESKRPFFKKTFQKEKNKMISLITEPWF